MTDKIAALVAELTLEEKAALVTGADFWNTVAVERLGIPSYRVSDGPHGVRTSVMDTGDEGISAICFPSSCAIGASFDVELQGKIGQVLGEECAALGIAVLLGPAANIKRSPLCGRNFEYISEDPVVTGHTAAALIKGIQSEGTGVSMKHFAANNQEFARLAVNAVIGERALREIYLAGFEYAVKHAKPRTIMCSYNQINGVHSSQNPWLLTEVLRGDWGFDGYVVSDWGAVDNRVKALEAGLDLEMPGPGRQRGDIIRAVESKELSEDILDRSVTRILKDVFKYAPRDAAFEYERHHALAVEAATESAVLLKNNNAVLPLSKTAKIAFIGEFAEKPRYQGGGSSNVRPYKVSSALAEAQAAGYSVTYSKGFIAHEPDERMFVKTDHVKFDHYDETLANEAVTAAKSADAVVIFAGLPDNFESEGYDRDHMRLPKSQDRLIREIAAVQPNVVVLLHNGSPVEMPWLDSVPAVLEMYLAGEGVGEATIKLLFGDANPSGKLAETFPVHLEDNPSYLNFPGTGQRVEYAEGIYVGYRYYDKKKLPVLFPFGHGLSYTQFEYSNMRRTGYNVSVDVTNIGTVKGKEVVQIYVSGFGTVRELKAYKKIELSPGETQTAAFELTEQSFSHWEQDGWYITPGDYEISAGSSSRDIRCSLTINLSDVKLPPFVVTNNTMSTELLRDPRTSEIYRKILSELGETGSAINSSAGFGMMAEVPIGRFVVQEYAEKRDGADLVALLNEKIAEKRVLDEIECV